ncbi:NADH:flavin oxidoreductase [Phenylobacterium sp.]|uniref:NADH:flavin oxidoreductase n=1 Tax=Phenylobacterium sp. TaxID=1871053 RepID=UPI002FD8E7CC
MSDLFAPLTFAHGAPMKNRFMLAPLTNQQSHADGTLSDEEFRWLTLRAEGGFGLTMTCAAHVQKNGQGFPGQLGIFSDDHLPGLRRLAQAIKDQDSLAVVQLHHAGNRSPKDLIGEAPVCPSDDPDTGARALTEAEVAELIEAFIAGAARAQSAGFDGVEIHGAHGYVLSQFLSPALNRRTDAYGGSPRNRARIVVEILEGVRARCGEDFLVGLRLSPERFGLELAEIRELAAQMLVHPALDFLDMSLWDVRKEPAEEAHKGRSLMSYFTELPRTHVRLGVAGKIMTAAQAREAMEAGADYVLIGRAAILHHDYPRKVAADPQFTPIALPVSRAYLAAEGLSPGFIDYMNNWPGFVAQEQKEDAL